MLFNYTNCGAKIRIFFFAPQKKFAIGTQLLYNIHCYRRIVIAIG